MPKLEWGKYPPDADDPYVDWIELSARQTFFSPDGTARWFTARIVANAQDAADGQKKPWHLQASLEGHEWTNQEYDTLGKAMQAGQKALDREWEYLKKEDEKEKGRAARIKAAGKTKNIESIKKKMKTTVDVLLAIQNAQIPPIYDRAPEVEGPEFKTEMKEYLNLARQVLDMEEARYDDPKDVEHELDERWGMSKEDWADLVDTLITWTRPFQDPTTRMSTHAFGRANPRDPSDWISIISHTPIHNWKEL